MSIDSVKGIGALDGGGAAGDLEIFLTPPLGQANGGTGGTTWAAARQNILTFPLSADRIGDTYYRNSLTAIARLPIGTEGQVLTAVTSGGNVIPGWRSPGAGPGPGDGSGEKQSPWLDYIDAAGKGLYAASFVHIMGPATGPGAGGFELDVVGNATATSFYVDGTQFATPGTAGKTALVNIDTINGIQVDKLGGGSNGAGFDHTLTENLCADYNNINRAGTVQAQSLLLYNKYDAAEISLDNSGNIAFGDFGNITVPVNLTVNGSIDIQGDFKVKGKPFEPPTTTGPSTGGVSNPMEIELCANGQDINQIRTAQIEFLLLYSDNKTAEISLDDVTGAIIFDGYDLDVRNGKYLKDGSEWGVSTGPGGVYSTWSEDTNANQKLLTNIPKIEFESVASAPGSVLGSLEFRNRAAGVASSPQGVIACQREDTNYRADMVFSATDGTALTERMRISTYGSVGIGNANPNPLYALDIDGSVNITGKYYIDDVEFIGGDGSNGSVVSGVANPMGQDLCAAGNNINQIYTAQMEFLLLYSDNQHAEISLDDTTGNVLFPGSINIADVLHVGDGGNVVIGSAAVISGDNNLNAVSITGNSAYGPGIIQLAQNPATGSDFPNQKLGDLLFYDSGNSTFSTPALAGEFYAYLPAGTTVGNRGGGFGWNLRPDNSPTGASNLAMQLDLTNGLRVYGAIHAETGVSVTGSAQYGPGIFTLQQSPAVGSPEGQHLGTIQFYDTNNTSGLNKLGGDFYVRTLQNSTAGNRGTAFGWATRPDNSSTGSCQVVMEVDLANGLQVDGNITASSALVARGVQATNNAGDAVFYANATTTGGFARLRLHTSTSSYGISLSDSTGDPRNSLLFYDSQSANPGFRFCIDENGRVGIGTSHPQYTLDVAGDAMVRNPFHVAASDLYLGGSAFYNTILHIACNTGNWRLTSGAGGNFSLINDTLGTQAFFIGPNGNVGVGPIYNPQFPLDVVGEANAGGYRVNGVPIAETLVRSGRDGRAVTGVVLRNIDSIEAPSGTATVDLVNLHAETITATDIQVIDLSDMKHWSRWRVDGLSFFNANVNEGWAPRIILTYDANHLTIGGYDSGIVTPNYFTFLDLDRRYGGVDGDAHWWFRGGADIDGDINITSGHSYKINGIDIADLLGGGSLTSPGVRNPMEEDLCVAGNNINEALLISTEFLALFSDHDVVEISLDANGKVQIPASLNVTGQLSINGVPLTATNGSRAAGGAHILTNVASIQGMYGAPVELDSVEIHTLTVDGQPVTGGDGNGSSGALNQSPWETNIDAHGHQLGDVSRLNLGRINPTDSDGIAKGPCLYMTAAQQDWFPTGSGMPSFELAVSSTSWELKGLDSTWATALNISNNGAIAMGGVWPDPDYALTVNGNVNIVGGGRGLYVNGVYVDVGAGWGADVNANGHSLIGAAELWIGTNPLARTGMSIDQQSMRWWRGTSRPQAWYFGLDDDGVMRLSYTTPPIGGPPQTRTCFEARESGLIEFPGGFSTNLLEMTGNGYAGMGPGWLALKYDDGQSQLAIGPDYVVMEPYFGGDRAYAGLWPNPDGSMTIRNGLNWADHDTEIDADGNLHVSGDINITSGHAYRINGTNIADIISGSAGSQSPWIDDVNASSHSLLNLTAIRYDEPSGPYRHQGGIYFDPGPSQITIRTGLFENKSFLFTYDGALVMQDDWSMGWDGTTFHMGTTGATSYYAPDLLTITPQANGTGYVGIDGGIGITGTLTGNTDRMVPLTFLRSGSSLPYATISVGMTGPPPNYGYPQLFFSTLNSNGVMTEMMSLGYGSVVNIGSATAAVATTIYGALTTRGIAGDSKYVTITNSAVTYFPTGGPIATWLVSMDDTAARDLHFQVGIGSSTTADRVVVKREGDLVLDVAGDIRLQASGETFRVTKNGWAYYAGATDIPNLQLSCTDQALTLTGRNSATPAEAFTILSLRPNYWGSGNPDWLFTGRVAATENLGVSWGPVFNPDSIKLTSSGIAFTKTPKDWPAFYIRCEDMATLKIASSSSGMPPTTTDRFFFKDDGKFGIGISTPSYQLHVATDSAGKPGTGGLWTVASDPRMKRNTTRFEGDINVIRQLRPIVSEYNGLGGTPDGLRVVSFDPGELQVILPQAVSTSRGKLREEDAEETDLYGVNLGEMLFHMLSAIQQLDHRLQEMETRIQ